MDIEHLKCGSFTLRCTVSVKYTPDFEDLVKKRILNISLINFMLITCLNDNILEILG